jgi:hypothetical protein
MSSAKFDKMSDGFQRLFSTPSLMKGEDPDIYAELYARVEEVVQPNDVWDQMMVADIANHFWEQQRYRRCTGTIINSKRRAALETILRKEIGLNSGDAQSVADIYFGLTRFEADSFIRYVDPAQIPQTRAGVIALLKKHGLLESDIDRVAMEASAEALTALENLAFRHEIRREAIFRELERRREKRSAQQQAADHARLNGRHRALAKDLPEQPLPSPTEPSP